MATRAVSAFATTDETECPTCLSEGKKTSILCRTHAWCSKRWFETLRWSLPLSTLPTPRMPA
jgi:hypothetical protein